MLNYEADAFEVFDFLLTCIHTWSQTASQPQKAIASQPLMPGVDYNLVRAANISCDKAHTQPCFVHNMFFLSEQ